MTQAEVIPIPIRMRLTQLKKRLVKKRTGLLKRRGIRSAAKQKRMEQAVAIAFNQGFDAGFDHAVLSKTPLLTGGESIEFSEKDYKRGLYDGGERIVDNILPEVELLPGITLQQIIEAGIAQMRPHIHRVLSAADVAARLVQALRDRTPLSVIRLGDGELLTMAQDVVMNEAQVRREGHFLSYAGIHLPDLAARDQLAHAARLANIVGIPKMRLPNFQPLAFQVLQAHAINYRLLELTLSTINYSLYSEGFLKGILADQQVLVVGNTASELSQVLLRSGIQVSGTVHPVNGVPDIPRVMSEIAACRFDIALVGAGIPAVIIVQRIASELGKVAIDFGHLADSFVKGEAEL